MQTNLIFMLVNVFVFYSFSQSIVSNGYTFTKTYNNSLRSHNPDWGKGDWTFDENQCEFTADNISFSSSGMSMQVSEKGSFKGRHPEKPFWGGEYFHYDQHLYGRYEVKIKPDTRKGMITSFFLLNIEWNQNFTKALEWSEIDIEFVGNNDTVQFNLHWIDENGDKHQIPVSKPIGKDIKNDFHLWTIEWTPTYIKFFLDGVEMHSYNDTKLLKEQQRPQEIRMNCWVSTSVEWAGRFNKSVLPVTTQYKDLVYYKLENPNALKDELKSNLSYVYDPVRKEIKFTIAEQVSEVTFFSTNGQQLESEQLNRNMFSIENPGNGMILVQVKVGGKVEKFKLPVF
ncbi:MAG: family 16 glycosylhydrolase [Cytophagales bacterium]